MIPLYIFDLDGTLALIQHRRHFVEPPNKKWDEFYAACVHNVPNKPVIQIMDTLLDAGADVVIYSGRSDVVREETIEWLSAHTSLDAHEINDAALRMRVHGDYTPDAELKRMWLLGMPSAQRERLVAVFEDRDRMVAMWRAEGLTCLQVAPGEF